MEASAQKWNKLEFRIWFYFGPKKINKQLWYAKVIW